MPGCFFGSRKLGLFVSVYNSDFDGFRHRLVWLQIIGLVVIGIVDLLLLVLGCFHVFLLIRGETTKSYLKKKYKNEVKQHSDWCQTTEVYMTYSKPMPE